ncbi:hypothetical protein OROHE_012836 [Orobanche hederae]
MLGLYVIKAEKFKHTWTGLSSESFGHVFSNFKLALPSAAMVCLECWAFEILVLLAGLMPNSEVSTSLIAMCVNTESIWVARGCGWQHLAVFINLGTFYLIGMPIAGLLAFKFNLHAKGLWIGLICGLFVQMLGLLLLTKFTKWTRIELSQDSSSKIVEEAY